MTRVVISGKYFYAQSIDFDHSISKGQTQQPWPVKRGTAVLTGDGSCRLPEVVAAGWEVQVRLETLDDSQGAHGGLSPALASMTAVIDQRSRLQARRHGPLDPVASLQVLCEWGDIEYNTEPVRQSSSCSCRLLLQFCLQIWLLYSHQQSIRPLV